MNEVVIGLDVGTSNVKCIAYDLDCGPPVVARREVTATQQGTRHEIDPVGLIDVVRSTLDECVEKVQGRDVAAIGVCTAMHGLCAIGRGDVPLTPIVTWADGRAIEEAAELGADPWHACTGTPVHPMSPFVKLAWFARHEPELFATARRWVDIKALVLHALTGEWVTDISSASGTGLVELGGRDWWPQACDAVGVRREQLPSIVPVSERLAAWGMDTVIVAGAGDGPTANIGVDATAPGVAALSVGTSAAMRIVTTQPDPPDATRFTYALDAGRWVTGGAISNAGSVDDWVRRMVAPDAADAALDALATSAPPGAAGLAMLPYLHPERAPRWDATIPAAVLGLRAEHGPEHLARAAIEGVGVQIALVAESLDASGPLGEIRATGGVFASPLWQQIIAAALARPVSMLGAVEAGSLGAAALALAATGHTGTVEQAVSALADLDAHIRVVEPDPELVDVAAVTRERIVSHLETLHR